MKRLLGIFFKSCLIIIFTMPSLAQIPNDPKLEILQIPDNVLEKSLPQIPWMSENINSIFQTDPLFSIKSNDSETAAKGWVGVNNNEIIIRIVVNDDYHINSQSGTMIWDGDAIQFGIDANGDGTRGQPKDVAYTGPDDASITVALTEDGPKAWAHYYGHPDGAGDFTRLKLDIIRNDKKQTTIYDIRLAWKSFQTKAGISSYMGFAFQINDTDKGPKQKRIYWGDGAGGNVRPGLFKRIRLDEPDEDVLSILPVKNEIWMAGDKAKVLVAVKKNHPLKIVAKYKNHKQEFEYLTVSTLQRFEIIAKAEELIRGEEKLSVSIIQNNKILAEKEIKLNSPGVILEDFEKTIDRLVATSSHPLYTKHLLSIKAITFDEWNKALTLLDKDPVHIQRANEYVQKILQGLKTQKHSWSDFTNGMTPFIFAFVSGEDRTLQFYWVTLPPGWNDNNRYPLIVELHGSGSPYPLDFFIGLFRDQKQNAVNDNVNAIVAAPWGRGNLGYSGLGESDVWEMMNEVKAMFKIDENQQYLTGFSMGGYGTWTLSVFALNLFLVNTIPIRGVNTLP